MFTLHPQLATDCAVVGDFPICRVLLNRQFAQFPWLILVPKRTALRDLSDLHELDYTAAMEEVRSAEIALKAFTGADKMNFGAIGNMVPQLHLHVIARFRTDEAWPKPVWGNAEPRPYTDAELAEMLENLRNILDVTEASE